MSCLTLLRPVAASLRGSASGRAVKLASDCSLSRFTPVRYSTKETSRFWQGSSIEDWKKSKTRVEHKQPPTLHRARPFTPPVAPQPGDLSAEMHLATYLQKVVPGLFTRSYVSEQGQLFIYTTPERIVPLLTFLRDHTNTLFEQLMDVWGNDHLQDGREKRFEVGYCALSVHYNKRLLIFVPCDENELVPSVVEVFTSANWLERETYDMFGIVFSDHPDLRRILTDYGFEGYPLRKDFPLSGYTEVRYDEEKKRVVQENVELTQEFRRFSFNSPWENPDLKLTQPNESP